MFFVPFGVLEDSLATEVFAELDPDNEHKDGRFITIAAKYEHIRNSFQSYGPKLQSIVIRYGTR